MASADCHTLRIDRSHHLLFSCKFWHQLSTIALSFCSSCQANLSCGNWFRRHHWLLIVLATYHQFPGDARDLVRQCHSDQLRLFALKQPKEPRGSIPAPGSADMLHDGSCSDYKCTPQQFVAGPRYGAEPALAGDLTP